MAEELGILELWRLLKYDGATTAAAFGNYMKVLEIDARPIGIGQNNITYPTLPTTRSVISEEFLRNCRNDCSCWRPTVTDYFVSAGGIHTHSFS